MSPEELPSQVVVEAATQGDEWDGPWGSIAPVPHSVETLCVQTESEIGKPRLYYYPYRTISKWNWNSGPPETLEILIGATQLTISGIGLRRLAEALNFGHLKLIQQAHLPAMTGETCIRAILID